MFYRKVEVTSYLNLNCFMPTVGNGASNWKLEELNRSSAVFDSYTANMFFDRRLQGI